MNIIGREVAVRLSVTIYDDRHVLSDIIPRTKLGYIRSVLANVVPNTFRSDIGPILPDVVAHRCCRRIDTVQAPQKRIVILASEQEQRLCVLRFRAGRYYHESRCNKKAERPGKSYDSHTGVVAIGLSTSGGQHTAAG